MVKSSHMNHFALLWESDYNESTHHRKNLFSFLIDVLCSAKEKWESEKLYCFLQSDTVISTEMRDIRDSTCSLTSAIIIFFKVHGI